MPTFPHFSAFDLSKLPELPVLPTLPKVDLPAVDADRVRGLVRDAAYVAIGVGVLTFQQLQVRRRELTARVNDNPVAEQLGLTKDRLEDLLSVLEERLGALDGRLEDVQDTFDDRIEALLTQLQPRLPESAGAVLGQAHGLAKAARKQARDLIRIAA